jgi:hypothetical protein
MIVSLRYDFGHTFDTLEEANNFINSNKYCFCHDYNTAIKVDSKWVITNKYDPYCSDKITPITPGLW